MALPQYKLDERTFQDLVDEAKTRIPRYCPEWTNHNVSDPGVTLIELFAYMVDQLLYQVNRVPEKNYRSFLDVIGVKLAPPNAAKADITFRLSAAQTNPITIPRGTQVATVRTENNQARIFTTEENLVISPPSLKYIVTTPNCQEPQPGLEGQRRVFTDRSKDALDRLPRPVEVFAPDPQPNNAFYLGFEHNIASSTMVIKLDCEKLGVGINPNDAPLIWEYWDRLQNEWASLEVVRDTTGGLTIGFAEVEVFMPYTAGQREVEIAATDEALLAWWVRCRYRDLDRNQPGYIKSPVVKKFSAYSIGGTIAASHSEVVKDEDLGRSDGEPGQTFKLRHTPILALNPHENETIVVYPPEGRTPEIWKQMPDFAESGPHDKHFVCDYVSGEISFGPAIRNPQGELEQRGEIPPYGSIINITSYRTGGGFEGNVGSNTITVLKSSIPYVNSVANFRQASGGTSAESLEHALIRGPQTLRARNRAVTAEDFEVLAREATSGIARVRCLTPSPLDKPRDKDAVEPGTVLLMIVPEVEKELRELRPEHLAIPATIRAAVSDYLDERRLLTTRVELTTPKYQWVTVQVRLKTINPYANERVKREAERRLYRFIRPVQGGPDPTGRFENLGEGWPFGRILYVSEIYPMLQMIEGVEFIEKIEMFPVIDLNRSTAANPVQIINPGPRGLLCSYRHQVVII